LTNHQQADKAETRLPEEFLDRVSEPVGRFLSIKAASGAVLLLFTLAALVLSNSPLAQPFLNAWETPIGFQVGSWELARTLRDWINDGLMTLFFFLISLELKRSIILGELQSLRIAALPISAAMGGMLVPALLYLMMQAGQPGQHGWGTVMASDTAFVIGCLALLGSRVSHQLRLFMLSLTIFDDIGAILVVTIGYSSQIVWPPLALAAVGIALMRAMTSIGFRGFPIFFFVGALIWLAVDASGVQATITGVVLGLMTPAHRWVSDDRLYAILNQVIAYPDTDLPGGGTRDRYTLQVAERAARETLSPLERLEILLHPWVGFAIIPLFAFANTGVTLSLDNIDGAITTAVLVALVIGKPVGIIVFSWLAVSSKIAARPPEVGWATLAGGGMIAGIGFTMALYIANLSFGEDLIDSAKLGIFLASAVSALAGFALLIWATAGATRAVTGPQT
jgi:NhaA family Na+:H+ antiporter